MYWGTQTFPGYTNPAFPYNSRHYTQDSDFRSIDLTGTWLCNDGGTYYIRQIPPVSIGGPPRVFWAGMSQRGVGDYFSNVFIGLPSRESIIRERSIINGRWADVPYGNARSSGILDLRVEDNGRRLRALGSTGGFGGSVWNKV